MIFLSGCQIQTNNREKINDLEYTMPDKREIPEDLAKILEEKKIREFKMTYAEEEDLYLCIGYGEQKTGGYSIEVKELYLSENAVYFDTNLIGPQSEEEIVKAPRYPYLVVKTQAVDKPVVFQ